MFDALKPGQTLTLAPGTYKHSGVLTISVPGVQINGNGATLQSTNDATSSLSITGDGVSLTNLNLTAPLTGTRYSSLNQNSLNIQGDNVTVSNVTITGAAAAGLFVFGASGFTISNVTVQRTRADGIHMTYGSSYGQLNNVTTKWTGDDGIAIVSYSNEQPTHDITINSPTVVGTTWGRGLSVVGSNNVTFNNINVSQTAAAAVYIASEGDPYYTLGVNNVSVLGGTITSANTDASVVHGAVLVYAGNSATGVANVTISGLTISKTTTTAQRNVAIISDGGSVSGVVLRNIALKTTALSPLDIGGVPSRSYSTSGWTLNGVPITVV